jgi:Ca2+-binding EF-hand superfamily protein
MLTTIGALAPLAAAVAQTPDPAPDNAVPQTQSSQQGSSFDSLDTNGDGRISKDEAAADANVTAQFSRYDKNGDGYIDRAEVSQANNPPPVKEQ